MLPSAIHFYSTACESIHAKSPVMLGNAGDVATDVFTFHSLRSLLHTMHQRLRSVYVRVTSSRTGDTSGCPARVLSIQQQQQQRLQRSLLSDACSLHALASARRIARGICRITVHAIHASRLSVYNKCLLVDRHVVGDSSLYVVVGLPREHGTGLGAEMLTSAASIWPRLTSLVHERAPADDENSKCAQFSTPRYGDMRDG